MAAIYATFTGCRMATRILGGSNEERLYLYDLKFDCDDDIIVVKKTDFPHMDHLIARHKGRYCIPAAFCRPRMMVPDFPCGSGYGAEILRPFGVHYEGRDVDKATIQYCRETQQAHFEVEDLTNPHLDQRAYDVIACIEGLEHIEERFQQRLIEHFYSALVYGGILVITTPERSGETVNQYHKHELTREEFEKLLKDRFKDTQILAIKDKVHTGTKTNLLFGICYKED